jgi:CRP/FNR family transcriptional regulator, cyclic AMP receptor protein
MPCDPEILRNVPLFALLDEDEVAVLAGQVEVRNFALRQRIYKMGDPSGRAYILVSGSVRVTIVDEDQQEIVVDEPATGEFFGFASMLDQTPHQTNATALEAAVCIEVDRHDIAVLLERKPHAGMDMLAVLGRQFHGAQQLVRLRSTRNPNEVIEKEATFGEHIADSVARFGGSWAFIISFLVVLVIYSAANVVLGRQAWDPYPFILLNLFLSMLAALQAPVIMMSQNRQDTKDRLRGELDFDVNRRAESEIQGLSRKLNSLDEKMGDIEDFLRGSQPAISKIASTSTAAPVGSETNPSALRA